MSDRVKCPAVHDLWAVKIIAALFLGVLFAGASDADEASDPPPSGMRQHAAPLEKFVQLRAGIKKTEVEMLLGRAGEHQFTYLDESGHAWQSEDLAVAQEPRYASSGFNLLYKDGALFSVVDSMDWWWHHKALIGVARGEIEDQEKQNERLRRTPIPKFDDDANVREFFRVKSLRGDAIAKSMPDLKKRILQEERENQAREKRNPPDPGLTVVITAFDLLNPSVQAEMRRAYKINAEFIKKFDGAKVPIGTSEARVNELFGPPLLKENMSDGRHAAIYGPKDTTAIAVVQPYLMIHPVLVLYRNNGVVRVLSNFYFDVGWRDRVWPELKSPERGSRPD
jgi:hypothetical protein